MSLTHQLRSTHDAILVGVGTLLADDPQLNVRLVQGPDPRPVVLDSNLRTPPTARILQRHPSALICTTHRAAPGRSRGLEDAGACVEFIAAAADGRVDLPHLLTRLQELGIKHLMVEGGAQIITSFLASRLVDHLVVTIAPVLVGGLRAVEGPIAVPTEEGSSDSVFSIEHFPRLDRFQAGLIGPDLVVWGKPKWKTS
jgi:3,4-dihydroxy 2-butanone 4-phosphate synthase/GTP cyclohydrolase II